MTQPLISMTRWVVAGVLAGLATGASADHAFVYSNGVFSFFDAPGALDTRPNGINDSGEIVGYFWHSSFVQRGFVKVGGSYSTIDVPGASLTRATGINNAGQIVGWFSRQQRKSRLSRHRRHLTHL